MLVKNMWKARVVCRTNIRNANGSQITFISTRGFSENNGEPKKDQDWQSYMTDQGMKTFEQVNDLLFPADQVKEFTDKEVL